ncbi:MAG TPA: hypothetical protein VNQ90_15595 [Chthoniobacteraceae bacterium]|nr:hypothetical protein [Chthoniobacteraceae bacterium]
MSDKKTSPTQPATPPKEAPRDVFYVYSRDGALYSLEINPQNPYGKTHRATTEGHTWEGTAAEFKRDFDRVD